jgi:hypothetical protein
LWQWLDELQGFLVRRKVKLRTANAERKTSNGPDSPDVFPIQRSTFDGGSSMFHGGEGYFFDGNFRNFVKRDGISSTYERRSFQGVACWKFRKPAWRFAPEMVTSRIQRPMLKIHFPVGHAGPFHNSAFDVS